MEDSIRVLVLGDIIGQPGCRAIFTGLKNIIQKHRVVLVVANGENAAEGRGITPTDTVSLQKSGVDVITSGNHIWQRREILPVLEADEYLLRPENYPVGVPGKGHCVVSVRDHKIGVCNLEGRLFLSNIRCPFKVGRETVSRLKRETNIIIVDFHAEAPEEKEALGLYLDGSVSAVLGTHTHVQTADERILPKGTAYITDIGMTGPTESCIGMATDTAIRRALTQMPLKMEVEDQVAEINGVLLEIDTRAGRATSIERIREAATV